MWGSRTVWTVWQVLSQTELHRGFVINQPTNQPIRQSVHAYSYFNPPFFASFLFSFLFNIHNWISPCFMNYPVQVFGSYSPQRIKLKKVKPIKHHNMKANLGQTPTTARALNTALHMNYTTSTEQVFHYILKTQYAFIAMKCIMLSHYFTPKIYLVFVLKHNKLCKFTM